MSDQLSKTEANLDLVIRFNDAVFVDNDFDRIPEFVSPGFVQIESGEITVEGTDDLIEYFQGMVDVYDAPTMDVLETVADDQRVMYRFRMSGTLTNDVEVDGKTVDAAGEELSWDGFVSLSIDDEMITEVNLLTDEAALYRQLGVLPEIAA